MLCDELYYFLKSAHGWYCYMYASLLNAGLWTFGLCFISLTAAIKANWVIKEKEKSQRYVVAFWKFAIRKGSIFARVLSLNGFIGYFWTKSLKFLASCLAMFLTILCPQGTPFYPQNNTRHPSMTNIGIKGLPLMVSFCCFHLPHSYEWQW